MPAAAPLLSARDDPVFALFGQANAPVSNALLVASPESHRAYTLSADCRQVPARSFTTPCCCCCQRMASPARTLPNAGLWQILHRRGKPSHGDAAQRFTLDNTRQTLAVLGYCRTDAIAVRAAARGRHAGPAGAGGRPEAQRIAVIAQIDRQGAQHWQEALYAALAAHAFALPTAKRQEQPRRSLARVDIRCVAAWTCIAPRYSADATQSGAASHRTAAQCARCRRHTGACWRTLARRHGLHAALARRAAAARTRRQRIPGRESRQCAARRRHCRTALHAAPRRAAAHPISRWWARACCSTPAAPTSSRTRSMLDMHTDMAGSAVALATLVAAARLRVPLAIDAWLAITENNIGPKAYRPQEVIRALNGVTIQVIHSDAEGRMALADTLALAARRRPHAIVDFATLTGACVYALTERMSGLFATDTTTGSRLAGRGRRQRRTAVEFPVAGGLRHRPRQPDCRHRAVRGRWQGRSHPCRALPEALRARRHPLGPRRSLLGHAPRRPRACAHGDHRLRCAPGADLRCSITQAPL